MNPYADQTMRGDPTEIAMIEGEPRISDRRLNRALGYTRISDLRHLIRARKEELSDYGKVLRIVAQNPSSPKGGRPRHDYWLNEHQATAICLWAETSKARAARRLIVEVFTTWRTGRELPPAPQVDPFQGNAQRAATTAAHVGAVGALEEFAVHATHLPIWPNGRRPKWWSNLPLRTLLTELHRQVTLAEAVAEAERRFGRGCVSTTSLQRYWARLDTAVGPVQRAALPPIPKPRLLN